MIPRSPQPPAIVVVDHEPDVRLILSRMIQAVAEGYEIVAVDDGAAALAVVAARPVPLLITGYRLLGMSGLDVVRAVKAWNATTTVVLISVYAPFELEYAAQVAGADYFVPKPFPFDRLMAIMRDVLA